MIVLPHRLSTVRSCDHVIVFQNGRIEERARPIQLQTESKLFRHLLYTEFNEFAAGEIEAGQLSRVSHHRKPHEIAGPVALGLLTLHGVQMNSLAIKIVDCRCDHEFGNVGTRVKLDQEFDRRRYVLGLKNDRAAFGSDRDWPGV